MLGITAMVLMCHACSFKPPRLGAPLKIMPTDAEAAMGRETHPEIIEQYGRYDDEALQGYIQRVGEQLVVANFGDQKIFRFVLLDSDEFNAFSLPGGYIYLTRGLLVCLNSEAELAAILAHEIAHSLQRHAAHHLLETELDEKDLVIGSILMHKLKTQAAIDLFKSMGRTLITGYEANEEFDATRLSGTILATAGYNPRVVITLRTFLRRHAEFDRQLAIEEDRAPHYFHGIGPIELVREKELQEAISQIKFKERPGNAVENLERFYNAIDGLVWGDNKFQGLMAGRSLLHSEWGVTLTPPERWRIINQNSRIVWFPANQDAYIELSIYPIPEKTNPQDFLRTELELQELNDMALFSPNGLTGYTATAKLRTPYGNQRGRVYVIYVNERALVFVSAGRTDIARIFHSEHVVAMVMSLRALSADEKAKIKPRRLKLITADKIATFESIVPKSLTINRPRDQIRLINQMYPSGQPRPGQRLKIIE